MCISGRGGLRRDGWIVTNRCVCAWFRFDHFMNAERWMMEFEKQLRLLQKDHWIQKSQNIFRWDCDLFRPLPPFIFSLSIWMILSVFSLFLSVEFRNGMSARFISNILKTLCLMILFFPLCLTGLIESGSFDSRTWTETTVFEISRCRATSWICWLRVYSTSEAWVYSAITGSYFVSNCGDLRFVGEYQKFIRELRQRTLGDAEGYFSIIRCCSSLLSGTPQCVWVEATLYCLLDFLAC